MKFKKPLEISRHVDILKFIDRIININNNNFFLDYLYPWVDCNEIHVSFESLQQEEHLNWNKNVIGQRSFFFFPNELLVVVLEYELRPEAFVPVTMVLHTVKSLWNNSVVRRASCPERGASDVARPSVNTDQSPPLLS